MKLNDLQMFRNRRLGWYNRLLFRLCRKLGINPNHTYSITLYPDRIEAEIFETPLRVVGYDIATRIETHDMRKK